MGAASASSRFGRASAARPSCAGTASSAAGFTSADAASTTSVFAFTRSVRVTFSFSTAALAGALAAGVSTRSFCTVLSGFCSCFCAALSGFGASAASARLRPRAGFSLRAFSPCAAFGLPRFGLTSAGASCAASFAGSGCAGAAFACSVALAAWRSRIISTSTALLVRAGIFSSMSFAICLRSATVFI